MARPVVRRLATHAALVLGCVVFAFPFAWLVTTSFKYNEEILVYPPRWVPGLPSPVRSSPYVTLESVAPAARPPAVDGARWARLRPRLEAALWTRALELDGPRLADSPVPADELRPAVTHALLALAVEGVPPAVWRGPDAPAVAAVSARADTTLLDAAWTAVYRSVELRAPAIQDLERQLSPLPSVPGTDLWQAITPGLWLRPGGGGLGDGRAAATSLGYDLAAATQVTVAAELPLPVPADRVLGLLLPIRLDRSWHRLRVVLELAGRRYVTADALYLDQYRWQELGLKLAHRDPRDERDLGTWPLIEADDQSGVRNRPGYARLTLTIERASRLAAVWRKYTQHYRGAYIATQHWWSYVGNSLYLAALTILGQALSCSLVAYAFSRLRWPGRDLFFGILLATMMLPGQVTMIPVFMVMEKLGWYNTLRALWAPSFLGSAFFIFMLRQFMKSIPTDLEDAARIDGCGRFAIYWRIVLPLVKPALAAVCIFTFMGTWNDFMGPLIYINDQRLYPLALGLFDFRTQHNTEFGMLMAASTLMTLPVIAIFFLAQKYFIQGITLTGMKG
ncbi:MAG: ABC transporter permease subunit [Gemmatimonadota bacterium]